VLQIFKQLLAEKIEKLRRIGSERIILRFYYIGAGFTLGTLSLAQLIAKKAITGMEI
jgi:hypothetical protein